MKDKRVTKSSVLFFKYLSPEICLKIDLVLKCFHECPFLNKTDQGTANFFIHGSFVQKNRVLPFEKTFELFERLCQGF